MKNLFADWKPETRLDVMLDDFREMKEYRDFIEHDSDELPEEQYAFLRQFLIGFPTEEMREAFPKIAEEFLSKEPFLKDPDKQEMFRHMYNPVRGEMNLQFPFTTAILQMMLLCAQSGSDYSRELLIGMYKTYYKQEYNVLKRYHVLALDDISEFEKMEAKRHGIPESEFDPEDEYDFLEFTAGRIFIMGGLMGVQFDRSWNAYVNYTNEEIMKIHSFWKLMEYLDEDETLMESQLENYQNASDLLTEVLPYVDWFLVDEDVENLNDPNQLLSLSMHVIEKAMDNRMVNSDLFVEDFTFDLRDSAVNALKDVMQWADIDPAESKDLIILFAVIRYLADIISELECLREKELQITLGFQYDDIITDEMMIEAGTDADLINKSQRSKAAYISNEDQVNRFLNKAADTLKKTPSGKRPAVKKENRDRSGDSSDHPEHIVKKTDGAESFSGNTPDNHTVEGLSEELKAKNSEIRELKNKLYQQHALLEESRKREISLRAHMDEWKRDQSELIALRNFTHNLESDDPPEEETGENDMIAELSGRKILIIGGHENWIKKMRRIFPNWMYIGGSSGLGITGAVESCEKLYFYTDICGHSMYYKFLRLASEHNKPYAFLHGTNTDRVIQSIYKDLIEK